MVTKTSMLESRFLIGDRELFNEFKERFKGMRRGREDEYIAWRLANQGETRQIRQQRFHAGAQREEWHRQACAITTVSSGSAISSEGFNTHRQAGRETLPA